MSAAAAAPASVNAANAAGTGFIGTFRACTGTSMCAAPSNLSSVKPVQTCAPLLLQVQVRRLDHLGEFDDVGIDDLLELGGGDAARIDGHGLELCRNAGILD